jgi:hypothetical protein
MEFKELLNELKDVLPVMAIQCLPFVLSEKTQRMLCELGREETGRILTRVIAQIDGGSVETIDALTQAILKREYPGRKKWFFC